MMKFIDFGTDWMFAHPWSFVVVVVVLVIGKAVEIFAAGRKAAGTFRFWFRKNP